MNTIYLNQEVIKIEGKILSFLNRPPIILQENSVFGGQWYQMKADFLRKGRLLRNLKAK